MFTHTVTIYNTETATAPDFSATTTIYPTVLRGVLVDAVKAVNVNKSGLVGADAVTLYIPFSVDSGGKPYKPPQEYAALADKAAAWSLTVNGNGGKTYFVKGEFITDSIDVLLMHDDCYTATKVDTKDYGGDMAHWEVGGV